MDILINLKTLRKTFKRNIANNDFFSDRLCHRHTTLLISLFVIVATFKKYYNQSINCWIPAQLKRYEKYINQYCWLRGAYHTKDLDIYVNDTNRDEFLLKYYQWVPLILLLQAFLFYLPRIIWYLISERILEFNIFDMVDAAIKYDIYGFDREKIFKYLNATLAHPDDSLRLPLKYLENEYKARELIKGYLIDGKARKSTLSWKQKIAHNLLTATYVFIKALYLFISCFQLYIMDKFLSNSHHEFYGSEVLSKIWYGYGDLHYEDSQIFPKISFCDVTIRELGDPHQYTIQCILSLNLFNERIFAFLWFWISFIIIPFLVYDLIKWMFILIFYGNHNYCYKFVKTRLASGEKFGKIEKYWLRIFSDLNLKPDGVFILRLIETNSNAAVVSDLLKTMWTKFCNNKPTTMLKIHDEIYQ